MDIIKKALALSDGSRVFNVRVQDGGEHLVFQAVSERDADALCDMLIRAISAHTNHVATFREG